MRYFGPTDLSSLHWTMPKLRSSLEFSDSLRQRRSKELSPSWTKWFRFSSKPRTSVKTFKFIKNIKLKFAVFFMNYETHSVCLKLCNMNPFNDRVEYLNNMIDPKFNLIIYKILVIKCIQVVVRPTHIKYNGVAAGEFFLIF